MAGAAQRDRAKRDASGGPSGSRHTHRPAQFGVIQAVAPSLGMEVIPVNVRDVPEIERAVAAFARSSNGSLIVTPSGFASVHRDLNFCMLTISRTPASTFFAIIQVSRTSILAQVTMSRLQSSPSKSAVA
jgi:hypothetical protein